MNRCSCGCGAFINGAGADVGQSVHARARSAAIQPPIPGGRTIPGTNVSRADWTGVQLFPKRPTVELEILGANAGVTPTTIASLPGRQPPPGWDGENDAWSPHGASVVS